MQIEVSEQSLWSLALNGQPINADSLAAALQAEAERELDFRSQLLIRDSINALAHHWGDARLQSWLDASTAGSKLREICGADLGPPGFTSLEHRVMDVTKPEMVMQFIRELGLRCTRPITLEVSGAIALILAGVLSRRTDDLDVVDEIPEAIRDELHLAHFQSHFLPVGWKDRLHSLGNFGNLNVQLVDPTDAFVGKLFSSRIKDRDDLRALSGVLDKSVIVSRLAQSAGTLLAQAPLAKNASDNWYILYGQPLPRNSGA